MSISRDERVLQLYEKLLEIEQRLIPTGLHVFGRASSNDEIADLLTAVASFDRPELEIRSLHDLVSEGLGFSAYSELLRMSSESAERLSEREQVEGLVKLAVNRFVERSADDAISSAVEFLTERAAVSPGESRKTFASLARVREQLESNHELDGLVRALRGEYLEPGPGADIIQNPGILPTGRNTHAINP